LCPSNARGCGCVRKREAEMTAVCEGLDISLDGDFGEREVTAEEANRLKEVTIEGLDKP